MNAKEKRQEEEIYDAFVTENASGNFLEIANEGLEALDMLGQKVHELEEKIRNGREEGGVRESHTTNENSAGREIARTLLPQLHLPMYEGHPLKWVEYWDCFEASVQNTTLSDIQKFHYLLGTLKGRAHAAIDGIAVTNANYYEAVEVLKVRFGNREIIKRSLYQRLRTIPAASGKIWELRSTAEEIDRICRQLKSLGEDMKQSTLMLIIQEKLPTSILIELATERSKRMSWDVDDLREHLHMLISVREEAAQINKVGQQFEQRKSMTVKESAQSGRVLDPFTVSSVYFEKRISGRAKKPCNFCMGFHFDDECTKYDSIIKRKERAVSLRLCFRCLGKGHFSQQCYFRRPCYHCRENHHRAFCDKRSCEESSVNGRNAETDSITGEVRRRELSEIRESQEAVSHPVREALNAAVDVSSSEKERELNVKESTSKGEVLLLTANATVLNLEDSERRERVTVFFDSGSQRSFVREEIKEKLCLRTISKEILRVYTFASKKPTDIHSSVVELGIVTKTGEIKTLQMNSLPLITKELRSKMLEKKVTPENIEKVVTIDEKMVTPDILIGGDYYWEFMISTEISRLPNGLHLIPTIIGNLVAGTEEMSSETITLVGAQMSTISVNVMSVSDENTETKPIPNNIEDFWSLEAIGINESPIVKDDDVAIASFNSTTRFESGRYVVRWPWKVSNPTLNDNLHLCYTRLKSMFRRCQECPEVLQKYQAVITEQEHQGIIEKVTPFSTTGEVVHYLPHHAVIKPAKTTTKIRLVYDASAKVNKRENSLNDCLYGGPVILPDLCGMLLRFRLNEIAIVADVEKAFLQISLDERDRDTTRFVCIRDPKLGIRWDNIEHFRFTRIAFGVISSPFLLSATIKYHLQKTQEAIVKQKMNKESLIKLQLAGEISKNIYIDNVMLGASSDNEARSKYQQAKKIFAQASMNLREWISNSPSFNEVIGKSDRIKDNNVKALGLIWDVQTDVLQININITEENNTEKITKRSILSKLASIYDPLGLISPANLKAKLLFQALWKGFSWDEVLPSRIQKEWNIIVNDWKSNPRFKLTRSVLPKTFQGTFQLHTFVDASCQAYAAVVYIRSQSGSVTRSRIAFAKNRLNPKKKFFDTATRTNGNANRNQSD